MPGDTEGIVHDGLIVVDNVDAGHLGEDLDRHAMTANLQLAAVEHNRCGRR